MKKSLLAAAVIAALPFAAQAQTSVTMYGIADANIGMKDAGGTTKNFFAVESGGQSTSRWGVRGSEDLGGGLSAVFQFEAGVKTDTGASDAAFWQRTSTVGLAGGFGTVRLGRTYTPSFLQQGSWDVLGYGLYGNHLSWSVNPTNLGTNSATAGSVRFSNGVFYNSPNWGGFTVNAAYSAGEQNTAPTSRGNAFSLAANYAHKVFSVGGYYDSENNTATPVAKLKRYGVGGGMNFGPARVLASYSIADPDGASNKAKFMSVGAGVKLGAGEVLVQYTDARQEVAAGTEPKTQTIGLAYVHSLSKRTNLYASAGVARNNATGTGVLRASDYGIAPAAAGEDPKAIMLGVRHMF